VIGTIALPGISKDVAIDEPLHVAVVVGSAGVTIVDVLDPAAMHVLGTVPVTGARHVSIKGHVAVVATGGSMVAVDVSTPLTPRVLSDLPGAFSDLSTLAGIDAPKLVVAAGTSESHVVAPIVDVHVPEFPEILKTIDFSPLDAVVAEDGTAPTNATAAATDGTFIYATVAAGAPVENGTTGETYLYIGQYLIPNDPYGFPAAAFFENVFPAFPLPQIRDGVVELGVYAIDDVALAAVKVFVNGQLAASAETPSSREWRGRFEVSIPLYATSVTLTIEAIDVGGNTSSRTQTFDVAPFIRGPNQNWTFPSTIGGIGTNGTTVWLTLPNNTDGYGVSKLRGVDGNYGFITPAAGLHRSTFVTVDAQNNAWVSNVDNNTVVEINDAGGQVRTVNVSGPGNLLYENGHIWVTSGSLNVVKIDAATGAVMGTFPTGGITPGVMTFDGANVWVVNKFQQTISKIRASDGALLGAFATATNVSGIAFDGTSIWTANRDDGTVSRIDPATGVRVATVQVTGTLGVGPGPTGVAFDGLHLWVVAFEGGKGLKIRPSDGAIVGSFYAPDQATAIVAAGTHLFVVDSGNHVWIYE
jgi:FOG: WD40-like repeat